MRKSHFGVSSWRRCASRCPSCAETVQIPAQTPEPAIDAPGVEAPLTWSYLATIAGAAAFTLLIVQFFKAPLDKVWKIPTRVFAYMVSLAVMLIATAFTSGLTAENVLLSRRQCFPGSHVRLRRL